MRQVHGTGIAQSEIMAFANVTGRAQADGRHPCGNGRPDTTGAVFDHETLIRAHAQSACGKQENVRMRLSARTMSALKDMAAEFRFQSQHRKASAAGDRIELEEAMQRGMWAEAPELEISSAALTIFQIRSETLQRGKLELAGKIGRQRPSDRRFNLRHGFVPPPAGIAR